MFLAFIAKTGLILNDNVSHIFDESCISTLYLFCMWLIGQYHTFSIHFNVLILLIFM